MLILKGKVSNIQDKNFTFSTVIGNEPKELQATYWKAKELEADKVYELVGDIDLDYLFTVQQHDISTYPSIAVVGTASYIKVNSKDGRNFVNFSVAVNQSGKNVYYQCSYNLRTDKLVGLFKNMADKSLVEVVGSLKLTSYKDKPQLSINVSTFNLLSKGTSNTEKAKSEDTEFDFAPTKTTTIPDEF